MHTSRTRRAGFGSLYLMVIAAVVLLASAGLVGLGLHRQATGTHQRLDGAAEMRAAGESYLQLATAAVNRWANEPGGPEHEGRELHELFRRTLLEAGAPSRVGLELRAEELLPDSPWGADDRYRLVDGVVAVVLRRARHFDGYDHQGGGTLQVSLRVEDTRGELASLEASAEYRYTVLVPSIPRPFDEFTVLVRDPRELVSEYDAAVRDFSRDRDQIRRDFRRILNELRSSPVLPGDLSGALEQLEEDSPLDEVPTLVARTSLGPGGLGGGGVMVARPEDGRIELPDLAVAGELREARDARAESQLMLEEAEAALQAIRQGDLTPAQLPVLAEALRSWGRVARQGYDTLEDGLGILQEVRRHVDILGGSFERRVREYWAELTPTRWRRRAHYRVEATDGAAAAEELRRLAERVRPLNGVVRVAIPEDAELVLRGDELGLHGRFVLVVDGGVRLEGFRPQASSAVSGADVTRAVVLAAGPVRISGEVQAAVVAHGGVALEDGSTLHGALLADRIEDAGALRGALQPLPEAGRPHRFTVRADDEVRQEAHFVAIDPAPTSRRSWFLDT